MYGRQFDIKGNMMHDIDYSTSTYSSDVTVFTPHFKVIPCSCETDDPDVVIVYDGGDVNGY